MASKQNNVKYASFQKETKRRWQILEEKVLKEHHAVQGTLKFGIAFHEKCLDGERC